MQKFFDKSNLIVLHFQVCNTVPVPQVHQAKETECQRCRKYAVPTPTTKWAIECNPVYDEKCKTRYVHLINYIITLNNLKYTAS